MQFFGGIELVVNVYLPTTQAFLKDWEDDAIVVVLATLAHAYEIKSPPWWLVTSRWNSVCTCWRLKGKKKKNSKV
ncbi:hypothetical protein D5086_002587 [Populus alba]|uniref:Uncharacterized protein n=1 Tax=Populus alba TaxID=43335 RepID=A0ACC4D1X7_POPAL